MSSPDSENRTAGSDDTTDAEGTDDQPSVRQLLHAATGDRDAEAKALADRAPDDVTEDEAKIAVKQAEGDMVAKRRPPSDVASPDDATGVKRS